MLEDSYTLQQWGSLAELSQPITKGTSETEEHSNEQ